MADRRAGESFISPPVGKLERAGSYVARAVGQSVLLYFLSRELFRDRTVEDSNYRYRVYP